MMLLGIYLHAAVAYSEYGSWPWKGGSTTALFAVTFGLIRAAWIPTLVIWHADGRFTRLEGEVCDGYAAALAASWRLWPPSWREGA